LEFLFGSMNGELYYHYHPHLERLNYFVIRFPPSSPYFVDFSCLCDSIMQEISIHEMRLDEGLLRLVHYGGGKRPGKAPVRESF